MQSFELYITTFPYLQLLFTMVFIITGGWTNAGLMLANRLRWRSIITSALLVARRFIKK